MIEDRDHLLHTAPEQLFPKWKQFATLQAMPDSVVSKMERTAADDEGEEGRR